MIVVALAGHVDHGKTALVRALTGVDTDRLKEEKERGMTTDLGFAALDLPASSSIPSRRAGLVDVPGHERYIRNMAAGAWGLDLALLCVAADDGWMAQTENHVRLLAALGPPRAIVVVTKADLVSEERAFVIGSEAVQKAAALLGEAAVLRDWVSTSARTGVGTAELLRSVAIEADAILSRRFGELASSQEGGYLYIDRIFSKKGSGMVLCGTLRGGTVSADQDLILECAGEPVRVKGIECLGERITVAPPGARVALNISRPKAEPRRGDMLRSVSCGTFFASRDFIARVREVPWSDGMPRKAERALEKGGDVEIVAGSAWRSASIMPIGKGPFYRVRCGEALALPARLPAALVRSGGAELLGRLSFIHAGSLDRTCRRKIAPLFPALSGCSDDFAASAIAAKLFGWSRISPVKEAAPGSVSARGALPENAGVSSLGFNMIGGCLVDPAALEGLKKSEAGTKKVPKEILFFLEKENHAASVRNSRTKPAELPPAAREAERRLLAAGKTGIEYNLPIMRGAPPLPTRADMRTLCAAGTAVPLDCDLFWHADTYRAVVAAVISNRAVGDLFTVGEAKEKSGLSRKYALPLLNRMERDGLVKRVGDARLVVRLS